ncbi:MAG: hypothetical protein AAF639_13250 [Chloroflexota bacterium]
MALAKALESNDELYELAQTPVMLSVMTFSYEKSVVVTSSSTACSWNTSLR